MGALALSSRAPFTRATSLPFIEDLASVPLGLLLHVLLKYSTCFLIFRDVETVSRGKLLPFFDLFVYRQFSL